MTRKEREKHIETKVLATDIEILDHANVSDETIKLLSAEHATRAITLAKMIDPSMGRALLLTISGACLKAANAIDASTNQEPELISV